MNTITDIREPDFHGEGFKKNSKRLIKSTVKPVHFYCAAPGAKSVSLIGDFNHWNPDTHPMQRQLDGWWYLQVPLPHGHHHYQFWVDGKPVLDPKAMGVARNERDEEVSVIAVS